MSATAIFPPTSGRSTPISIPPKNDMTTHSKDKLSLYTSSPSSLPSLSNPLSLSSSISSTASSHTMGSATFNNSYREIIRQLAAQSTTKPYGDIPVPSSLINDSKKKKQQQASTVTSNLIINKRPTHKLVRRMSHVEDWIVVDSKESLPDEEELIVPTLSIRNLFSDDFFTEVLPLHMPPPSLSRRTVSENEGKEETEDEEEQETAPLHRRQTISNNFIQKSSPTSSTTVSYAVSSSPPRLLSGEWKETLAKLKRSLLTPPTASNANTLSRSLTNERNNNNTALTKLPKPSKSSSTAKDGQQKKLIPMPIPPKRPTGNAKRRSEATTQPRFNPDTNTYLRDTRSNSDHLRMISAELNMMRCKKLLSPLKPRGFLPRRKDVFVRGEQRKLSKLRYSSSALAAT